jgi:methyltransferase-like protein 23
MKAPDEPTVLRTTAGDFPLGLCRLEVGGRRWEVLHAGAIITREDEKRFLAGEAAGRPYGVALWPSAVALAHEIALCASAFAGRSVLELGAGTGLPGNGQRNGAVAEVRLADWTEWGEAARYDWILGADILYADTLHPHLRRIFANNLTTGRRVLVADPIREVSFRLLEALQSEGWAVSWNKWTVGEPPRPVGVFNLTPPEQGRASPR